jgi:class 3 adenylate cyclase
MRATPFGKARKPDDGAADSGAYNIVSGFCNIVSHFDLGRGVILGKTIQQLDHIMADLPPHLHAAIQALEAQRPLLGDAAVEAAIAALKAQSPPHAPAQDPSAAFAGERKLVTIMFADLSGFTALSERLDPEEVRALMNRCFDQLVPVIHKYDGVIDKFIGDEVMALFGAPRAHERHAELACRAALELMDALQAFNRHNHTSLQLHTGINTGLVIAGGIGSQGRLQYSVMGDAVNLAARLKEAARPGEIFIGGETYALSAHRFEFFALPPMRVKGKSEVVQVYSLHKAKAEGETAQGGRLRADLIGREAELAALAATIGELENGRGTRLALIGEAGIGKSRLIAEARKHAVGITWIEGRALSYTQQNSYQPAVEMLRKLLGVPAEAAEAELRARLHGELEALFPEEGQQLFPYLASLIQLSLGEDEQQSIQFLHAERLRERIHEAFRRYLAAKAARHPLVLVWEDLHWADPSSLLLLEQVLELADSHPILFLLLFRPRLEERIWQLHLAAQEKYREGYRSLALEALSPASSSALARSLLRIERLSPEVERLVFEKAEGNPFFVEELLRSLLDKGLLFLEQFEIQAASNLGGLSLPNTLQGIIASRMDQLSTADKAVLQVAAILGRFFNLDALRELLRQVDPALQPDHSLDSLLQRELIRRSEQNRQDEEGSFVFKHAVTHEVAYESLLLADRRRLHRLAGEVIENLSADTRDEQAAILAMHFENAQEGTRAVHYLRLAAGRAQRLFANEEAMAFYQRAIKQAQALLDQGGTPRSWSAELAELQEQLADIQRLTGKYEESLANYRLSQARHEPENWIAKSRLERKMGLAHNAHSHFDQMLEHFQQAKDLLRREQSLRSSQWWHEWLEVHIEQTMVHYWVDQPDQMHAIANELQPELDAYGTPVQRAMFLSYFLGMNFRLERFLLSDETIRKGWDLLALGRQLTDLRPRSFNCFMVGFALLWHNSLDEALRVLEEGLPMTEQTGDVVLQSRYLTYLTVVLRRLGRLPETEAAAQRSLSVARVAGMQEYVGTAYANQAWVAWKRGDLSQAESLGRKAFDDWISLPQTHASLVFAWIAAWPLAASCFQRGNLTTCIQYLEEMIHPRCKRLETELEAQLEQVIQNFRHGEGEALRHELEKTFFLAERYRYL